MSELKILRTFLLIFWISFELISIENWFSMIVQLILIYSHFYFELFNSSIMIICLSYCFWRAFKFILRKSQIVYEIVVFLGIGGTRFISFEDRHWHNDCFICASCKSSLVGRGFITDEADIICPDCAKAKLM